MLKNINQRILHVNSVSTGKARSPGSPFFISKKEESPIASGLSSIECQIVGQQLSISNFATVSTEQKLIFPKSEPMFGRENRIDQ